MAFSTRACASWREAGIATLAGLLILLAGGCAQGADGFGISLHDLNVSRSRDGVEVHARQEIELSSEAGRALRHGVPLRLRLDVALRAQGQWSALKGASLYYEIRYLPLSGHYQLTGPGPEGPARNYPRLRHVLAELSDIELRLPTDEAAPRSLEVRMRSRLDRSRLPGPMQLPALLSSQWAHDSGWVSGQFDLGG